MRFFRRSLIALGVAAMLPTIVFAAVGVFYFLRAERQRVETATLARSEVLMTLVDARVQRDVAALNVLSGAIYFDTGDWAEFYSRVRRVLDTNPMWATIVLIDAERRQQIFDMRSAFGPPAPLDERQRDALSTALRASGPFAGDVERDEQALVWIYVPVARHARTRYLLAVGIQPRVFQDLLVSMAQAGSIAAIVDRHGNFIARTRDYDKRVGTPATQFVRNAMETGKRGFYRGTTYEGLKNYTAFYTSQSSGWSAHLAVASSLIDAPTTWSLAVAIFAGVGSLLLGGTLVVLVLRDMSERRSAEEALRQSQKMEAVGQLTGGIAHDFNNLLTAIIGNLDMIRTRAVGNERLQRLSENALEAARRGAKLASQLLAFSRTQRMTVGQVDLQQLLGGMSGLLTQSVGPTIQVRVHVAPDARHIVSDANQLELALLNLAVNARDAMSGGGVLTISTRHAATVDRHLPKREYVDLFVSDTGSGMPDEVRARAIEPFYTTKPVGQGTGLGLSQVYGVVRESGGTMSIDSKVGRGTTVCLTLPRASAKAVGVGPDYDAPPTVPKPGLGEEPCVLVVDDDRLVRRFMAESLRSLRYDVIAVENGAAALDILDAKRVDLLLVDFAMPGMNGADVARAAQNKQPGLPVLIVSGYSDTAAVEAALGSARQLRKPFDLAELGAAVADTLRSR